MDRIVFYPESVLRKSLPECRLGAGEIQKITERLSKVLAREKHGIGIAAPQLGISERIAIVDVSARDTSCRKIILINPIILEGRDPEIGREGCMSVPDYTALVKRYRWVRYRFQNPEGKWLEKTSTGIEAICVQHEIDHLNGKLLIDAVTCLKTDLLPRRGSKSA
ncbi:MAG TPA: peptide deformylase [Candidatus Omnitrophota bacterium]|nr:peptide deformylase [Candidatus Omnitrophota bacterium]